MAEDTVGIVTSTEAWRGAHPGALIGVLEVSHVDNRSAAPELEARKRAIEGRLRQNFGRYTRAEFVALPVMRDYVRYYRKFDKTYHVLQQLESVALKGKSLPSISPLVDANFAAELETLVLTAGHDLGKLEAPLCIDFSREGDSLVPMNGSAKRLPAGDMVMRDAKGIACSILYGQDSRSPISASTTSALYVAYAPAGVGEAAVRAQLDAILFNVRNFAPSCAVEQRAILAA
jgi:DNA/RNA-binding domain of Phe-tRNA-synthetase-like protein